MPVSQTLPTAVLLGAAVLHDGRPSAALERRARHAARLHLDGIVGAIVACGGIVRHPPAEAALARDLLIAFGVSDRAIHVEDRSATTLENLTHARPILDRIGSGPIIVVTDRYHAKRALLVARHLGIDATASCPAPDDASRLRLARSLLHEIPATWLYRWRLRRL